MHGETIKVGEISSSIPVDISRNSNFAQGEGCAAQLTEKSGARQLSYCKESEALAALGRGSL